jgi:ABC-type multidrug transport system ATPase subunit
MLELSDLWYRHPGARAGAEDVLRGADAVFGPGEAVGIAGRNGAGKSTLLKVTANLLRPARGRILFGGRPVGAHDRAFRSVLNYCAGAPQGFYPRLTAVENLRFFSGMKGRMYGRSEALAVLGRVGLTGAADAGYSTFSLGMRQRLHLACLLLEPAGLWILDEPTTGLDEEGMEMLRELLDSAADKTRIIVSHDAGFLSGATTRTLRLADGLLRPGG